MDMDEYRRIGRSNGKVPFVEPMLQNLKNSKTKLCTFVNQ